MLDLKKAATRAVSAAQDPALHSCPSSPKRGMRMREPCPLRIARCSLGACATSVQGDSQLPLVALFGNEQTSAE
jgi:hypothetical protein